jgi:HK97 family phage major capsid protein
MKTLIEMRQKRGEIVAQMRGLTDKAASENRDLNAEEQQQWDAMDRDQDALRLQIEREERLANLEAEMNAPMEPINRPDVDNSDAGGRPHPCAGDAYRNAFLAYARLGKNGITSDIVGALQVGTDTEGGYIVPEEFETRLVQALDEFNVMRSLCSVITAGADRNIPVETDYGAADWIAEEAAYTEGDPAFDRVILSAHKVGKIVKVSEELLQDAFFDLEAYLVANFGRAIGLAEEAAFVNGNGTGKPAGIVGAAGVGVTAASATAITDDE